MPKIPWELITTIVVAIVSSTWFSNWVQSRSKFSNKALWNELQKQDWEHKKDKADACRRRILQFDGELRRGVHHTEEEYNNNNQDIDFYENFCKDNPHYPNTKAVSAIAHAKEDYRERLKKNDFLK